MTSLDNDQTEAVDARPVSENSRQSVSRQSVVLKFALAATIVLLIVLSNIWLSGTSPKGISPKGAGSKGGATSIWKRIDNAETTLREGYARRPVMYLSIAFVIYVVAVGFSLPISTLLSLSYAWLFGWMAIPLLNVAATCGATLAFLSARFLFRDWVQARFGKYLVTVNQGFERDGAFYIVSLRMVALFPFFVVNLVLGLVPVKTQTYFFATMIGMLPLNFAFVYFGMQIPSVSKIAENGIGGLISFPLILGIALVGLLPTFLRWVVQRKGGLN